VSNDDFRNIPVLLKRKLQAEVIGPIYREMVDAVGEDQANAILDRAIRKASVEEGKRFAGDSKVSLTDFKKLFGLWTESGALEIEVLADTAQQFDFDVTRCRYAELYRDMGLGKIGHLLSCNRDAGFAEGYDPSMTLERKQTIMQGASCCTFRYLKKAAPVADS
jgi:L-2-amino-thiazoline-4-carboxylic acid hydrolase